MTVGIGTILDRFWTDFCSIFVLLLALGAKEHNHPFSLEVWDVIRLAEFFEVSRESCEEEFALLLEDDGPSAEEDIGLDFVSLFKEFLGVLELEVVIVVIGLRSETNLLHLLLLLVRLCLFLLFLLRVEEFLVVNDSADRRIRSSRDLDQIEVEVIGYFHSLLKRVDTLLYIIANKAHLCDTANLIVNTMRVFFNNSTATRSGRNSCYSFSR